MRADSLPINKYTYITWTFITGYLLTVSRSHDSFAHWLYTSLLLNLTRLVHCSDRLGSVLGRRLLTAVSRRHSRRQRPSGQQCWWTISAMSIRLHLTGCRWWQRPAVMYGSPGVCMVVNSIGIGDWDAVRSQPWWLGLEVAATRPSSSQFGGRLPCVGDALASFPCSFKLAVRWTSPFVEWRAPNAPRVSSRLRVYPIRRLETVKFRFWCIGVSQSPFSSSMQKTASLFHAQVMAPNPTNLY